MHFEARNRGAVRLNLEQTFLHPWFQVNPDGTHIANNLTGRILEGKIEGALAAAAGSLDKVRGETALAGTCRARDQHAAALVIARSAQHGVEARNTGGDSS